MENSIDEVSSPFMNETESQLRYSEWVDMAVKRDSLWVVPIMLLITAFLQFKSHLLWSDSRTIRKLRTELEHRNPESLRSDVRRYIGRECSSQECFAHLYVRMSKGRHRRVGRLYSHLYILFTWVIHSLTLSPLVHSILASDAVIGIRILIAVGSLAVLGARRLNLVETVFILLFLMVYVCGVLFIPDFAFLNFAFLFVCVAAGLATIAVGIIFIAILGWRDWKSTATHVSCTANAILRRTIETDGPQHMRYQNMCKLIQTGEKNRGAPGGKYWPIGRKWIVLSVTVIIYLINVITLHKREFIRLPAFIITEVADFLSLVLLFLNDTQVEPTLFIELLRVAEGTDSEPAIDAKGENHMPVPQSYNPYLGW